MRNWRSLGKPSLGSRNGDEVEEEEERERVKGEGGWTM